MTRPKGSLFRDQTRIPEGLPVSIACHGCICCITRKQAVRMVLHPWLWVISLPYVYTYRERPSRNSSHAPSHILRGTLCLGRSFTCYSRSYSFNGICLTRAWPMKSTVPTKLIITTVKVCTGPPAEKWLSWLGTNIREDTLNRGDRQLSLGLRGCLEFFHEGHAVFRVQKIIS